MNSNKSSVLALTICLVAYCFSLNAQTKNTVILINSVPYNVVLSSSGDIAEVKGEANNHMRGYIKSKEEFSKVEMAGDKPSDKVIKPGATVSRERQFFTFESGYAVMDDALTNSLQNVVNAYSTDEQILLTAHKIMDSESDELYQNRLKSIKTFLQLKGIPANRISTEIVVSSPLADKVSVSFVQ